VQGASTNMYYELGGPEKQKSFIKTKDESKMYPEQPPAIFSTSRYKTDFEELVKIGEGGAGRVFLAKHRID
jgi:hypothetical protein